jgi:hypothetical protein
MMPWWGRRPEGMLREGTRSVLVRIMSIGQSRLVLFLDFEGALVSIAARPEHVALKETVRRGRGLLAHRIPIVIVSGWPVGDLRRIMGVRHLHLYRPARFLLCGTW